MENSSSSHIDLEKKSHSIPLPLLEEICNIAVSGVGLFLSLIGFAFMVILLGKGSYTITQMLSFSIYVVSLPFLYIASMLLHSALAMEHSHYKAFEILDHCAIFLLIAGTYTPFTLVVLQGILGWSMFGLIWGLAVFGILYKIFYYYRSDLLSTLTFIGMGWLILPAFKPMLAALGVSGMLWLGAGGLFFTFGAGFYVWDHKFRFAHALWHLCVLAGSICHYVAVIVYLVRPQGLLL